MIMNAASLILLALVAQATPSPASPDEKARAQVLLKEGAKLYEKGALAPALEKFNQAYAEYPSPKLLFNIGQASRDLGRLAEAMSAFEHFLTEATDAPADMTTEARKSVAELEGKLGKLRIQCAKPGAEISVDGKPVGLAPIAELIWVMPGSHQVTARHPATAPAIEDVEVNASWVHTVVITLQPLTKPVAVVPAPLPPAVAEPVSPAEPSVDVQADNKPAPTPPTAQEGARGRRVWTWVAGGSAVVFAGTAIFFGVSTQSKFDSLNKSCGSGSGPNYPGCTQSDIDSVLLRRNLANVSWGLAAAAAATAGVLFFVEGRSVSVAPMAGEATGFVARMAY
jgi:hypothetical protein